MIDPNKGQSFEIGNHHDFSKMFLDQYDDFLKGDNIISSRHAIVCAMMSYHLREWVWKSDPDSVVKMLLKLRLVKETDIGNDRFIECKFNEYTNEICPEIKIMRDICNGSKHCAIEAKNVKNSYLNKGTFNPAFNGHAFDTYDLVIFDENGERLIFKNEIEKVVSFWEDFFEKYLK